MVDNIETTEQGIEFLILFFCERNLEVFGNKKSYSQNVLPLFFCSKSVWYRFLQTAIDTDIKSSIITTIYQLGSKDQICHSFYFYRFAYIMICFVFLVIIYEIIIRLKNNNRKIFHFLSGFVFHLFPRLRPFKKRTNFVLFPKMRYDEGPRKKKRETFPMYIKYQISTWWRSLN